MDTDTQSLRTPDKILLVWLAISVAFLCWYFPTQEGSVIPLYYALWLGGIGVPLWTWRTRLTTVARRLIARPTLRFMTLAYGMVIIEETIAGAVHAVQGGFSADLLATRIGQFCLFNLIAFSGLILAWTLLTRRYEYSRREIFYLMGIWGLYAEGILGTLWTTPLSFAFFALPTMFTYGLVMAPSAMATEAAGRKRAPAIARYTLALCLPFLLSIPFMLFLNQARSEYPGAFPPCEFIACSQE